MSEVTFKLASDPSQFLTGIQVADNAQKNLDKGIKEFEKDSKKAFDNAGNSAKEYGDETGKTAEKTKSLKAQLRELKAELANATDPKDVERLAKAAGKLEDQIGDAADAAAVFASDSPFEQIGNSISSVGSKLRNLDFKGAADQSKLMVAATKQLTLKEGIAGVKDLGKTFLNIGKSLLMNPIFLIGAALALIITNFDKLTNAGGIVGDVFKSIGNAIEYVIDLGSDFLNFIGLIDSTKQSLEELTKANDAFATALSGRYDLEIAKAKAAGKSIEKLERDRLLASKKILQENRENTIKAYAEGQFDLKEYVEKIGAIDQQANKISADLLNLQVEQEKKAFEAKKKISDDYKKNKEALTTALIDLNKRTQQAELNGLTGIEKLNKQKEISEKEITDLRAVIQKKGELTNKNFKFTVEQEAEFAKLKMAVNREYYNGVLQLAIQAAQEEANVNKAKNDTALQNLEYENTIVKNGIESIKANQKAGASEIAALEKEKSIMLLQQELSYQQEKEKLVLSGIEAERKIKVAALSSELSIISKKDDAISKARVEAINKEIESINQNSELAKAAAMSSAQNVITGIQEELNKTNKPVKLNWVKILGLDSTELAALINVKLNAKVKAEDIEQAKKALGQLVDIVGQVTNAYFDSEQSRLDKELSANQEKIDARNENIRNLQASLDKEKELADQGFANNAQRLQDAIAEQERGRQKDLANEKKLKDEKKKLAKQQMDINTVMEASNLVVAVSEVFSTYAAVPYVAAALAVAMVGAFAYTKSLAYDAVDKQDFWKGGYTGDGGKYEEKGTVHGGEFVSTKETTSKHRNLLEGLHKDDPRLIEIGISELLKGTRVSLPNISKGLNESKTSLRAAEMQAYFNTDNSDLVNRLNNVEGVLERIYSQGQERKTVMPDGSIHLQKGNSLTIIRPKS